MESPSFRYSAALQPSNGINDDELRTTANELYRRMGQSGFASEDLYWSSLPSHLRNFIRNTLPLVEAFDRPRQTPDMLPGGAQGAGGQKAMYSLAQHIVHAARQGIPEARGGSLYPQSRAGSDTPQLSGPASQLELTSDHLKPAAKYDSSSIRTLPRHAPSSTESFALNAAPGNKTEFVASQHTAKHARQNDILYEKPASPLTPPVAAPTSPRAQIPGGPLPRSATNTPTNTIPSSRAVGKQPMVTASTKPSGGAADGTNSSSGHPNRSARSAGKAPVPPSLPTTSTAQQPSQSAGVAHKSTASSVGNARNGSTAVPQTPKVWQTSTNDERHKIRQFWDSLGPESRRKLLKVEKEAVFRKMKEQQRHSCDCAVCGRKRAAVEQELEVLYDSYSQELDSKAVTQNQFVSSHGPSACVGDSVGPFPGSVEIDDEGNIVRQDLHPQQVRNGRRNPLSEEAADSEEEYEDEDEDYDEEDEDDLVDDEDIGTDDADHLGNESDDLAERNDGGQYPSGHTLAQTNTRVNSAQRHDNAEPAGNALRRDFGAMWGDLASVQEGVLLAADDLLKNDCAKFLQMMEQLAEIRTTREIAASRDIENSVDSDCDADYDGDLDDDPTEAQKERVNTATYRLQEGRRVFQIFAARLFEQRVLQAYREQLAQQKQLQFLRELEEEETAAEAREARKAKDAQKKKDKKRQQKQAKEDEKARKEAAAAAEAEASRLKQLHQEREAARKREDDKQRKEAERRAKVEESQRKEEERRRRQQEEREKEAERQRKVKERDDRVKAERAAKDKEIQEKEERQRLAQLEEKGKQSGSPPLARSMPSSALPVNPGSAISSSTSHVKPRSNPPASPTAAPRDKQLPAVAVTALGTGTKGPPQSGVGFAKLLETSKRGVRDSQASSVSPPGPNKNRPTKLPMSQIAPLPPPPPEPSVSQILPHVAVEMATRVAPNDAAQSQAFSAVEALPGPLSEATSHIQDSLMPDAVSPGQGITPQSVQYPSQPFFTASAAGSVAAIGTSRSFSQSATGSSVGPRPYSDRISLTLPHPPSYAPSAQTIFPAAFADGSQGQGGLSRDGPNPVHVAPVPLDFRPQFSLPDPIGPIQPIGRPRPPAADISESPIVSLQSDIGFASQPNRVLGSAALSSGDDEVIMPAPRRISHAPGPAVHWNHSPVVSGLAPPWTTALTSTQPDIWHRTAPSAQHPLHWSSGHIGQPQSVVPRFDGHHAPPSSR